jgi:regulator of PEP synthase PpsR (kinase-PPPase family)
MGSEAVEEHFNEFSSKDRFSDFLIIDSSNEAAEETAQKIKDLIDKQL